MPTSWFDAYHRPLHIDMPVQPQDTTKLDVFLHKLNGGAIARRFFKLRVAPEEVGCALTGFGHNAVSPVGMATRLPIIVASTIPALKPDVFWMGGGEVCAADE